MTSFRSSLARTLGRWLGADVAGVDRTIRLLHRPDDQRRPAVTVVRSTFGPSFHVNTSSYLEWMMFMYGEYEPELRQWLVSHLAPGDNAIDIGANIGVHTLAMAQAVGPAGHVYAFEPFDEVRVRLLANVALNGFQDRVTVYGCAVCDRDGEARAAAPTTDNRGLLELRADGETLIKTRALDSLALPRAKVLKIDAQGAEGSIVRGGMRYLGAVRPLVAFEDVKAPDVAAALAGLGYTVRRNAIREVSLAV